MLVKCAILECLDWKHCIIRKPWIGTIRGIALLLAWIQALRGQY